MFIFNVLGFTEYLW